MIPAEIIRRKRDGHPLSAGEIADFIDGLTRETVSAEQAAAFAMAVFFRGMSAAEAGALTRAMASSGATLDWSREDLRGPVLDKHSTGGIGDNVSLVLAPLIAACGAHVPMIAGRGLGHTGGTVDKLEAVPGYRTNPDQTLFREVVRDVGCAIIGQTADLAPADRRLYAIRDVTATVESIPLITASILSKKLAAGLGGLVMDVKCGNGAFMATREDARNLARSLVDTGVAAGLPMTALITAMDQPLASCAGNAVEVRHAIEHLTRERREPRFVKALLALAAEMLVLAGVDATLERAHARAEHVLASGAAAEKFERMCVAFGGPPDILARHAAHLPAAPVVRKVRATERGVVTGIDTRALGLAVIDLGGGRRQATDAIDHAVGLTDLAGLGDSTDAPLAVVHARDATSAERAAHAVLTAYKIGGANVTALPTVLERVEAL